jgi:hypothetical protein
MPPYGSKVVMNIEGHESMSNDVTAVIIRKTDQNQHGTLYLMVRASVFGEDKAIAVSRQDYDRLQPGGLVSLRHAGWGPIGKWLLNR